MVQPVTDPLLLQQLNAPVGGGAPAPVSDPLILQQLNADAPRAPAPQRFNDWMPGWMQKSDNAVKDFHDQATRAMTFGLSDKVGAIPHALSGSGTFSDLYHEGLAQARQAGEDYAKDHPIASPIATTLGTAASLPANMATGPLSLGQMMKQGGLIGGVSGFGVADDKSVAGDIGSTVIGGGIGSLTSLAMGLGSRALFPNVAPGISEIANEGGKPSLGQIMGNKVDEHLSELPFTSGAINEARAQAADKFARITIDKALEPVGEKLSATTPTGQPAVAEMLDKIGNVYNRFSKDAVVPLNPTADFAVARAQVPKGLQGDFDEFIQKAVTDRMKNGELSGEAWRAARSKLGDYAERYINRGTAQEVGLGEGLQAAQDALHSALGRASPEASAELANANRAWAMARGVNRAANYIDAVKNGGMFTPSQYLQAVTATSGGQAGSGRALNQPWAQSAFQALGDNAAMKGPGLSPGAIAVSPLTAPVGGLARLGYGPANTIAAYLARTNRPTLPMAAQFLNRAAPTVAGRTAQAAPGLIDQSAWQ